MRAGALAQGGRKEGKREGEKEGGREGGKTVGEKASIPSPHLLHGTLTALAPRPSFPTSLPPLLPACRRPGAGRVRELAPHNLNLGGDIVCCEGGKEGG